MALKVCSCHSTGEQKFREAFRTTDFLHPSDKKEEEEEDEEEEEEGEEEGLCSLLPHILITLLTPTALRGKADERNGFVGADKNLKIRDFPTDT